MSNLKVLLEEKLSDLKLELEKTTSEIEISRTVDQEEDVSIRNELLDKKTILSQQIEEIEDELLEINKNGKYLNPDTFSVDIGNSVELDVNGARRMISIVSSAQADPSKGYISVDSPLGMAMVGRKKGETVSLETPAGTQSYEILKIQ